MKTHNLVQGSPEWHAHRISHFNASDAPAMMGCSSYRTRDDLLRAVATGVEPEIDAETQRRFDDGHRCEALARPLAEAIIGEDLYPVTGSEGHYSASFDGLTLLNDVAFEHKRLNATLREVLRREGVTGDDLPIEYRVQMEHQALVSGCERVLFMASEWTASGDLAEELHCWYMPDPTLRARIMSGWEHFAADVATYAPPKTASELVVGRAPGQLPTIRIDVTGAVLASNLADFTEQAIAVFQSINTDLQTDQDFADADETVKWLAEIEGKLKSAKDQVLSQTVSIEQVFRAIDNIGAEARQKRLALEKLVKARKEERRDEIIEEARKTVIAHYDQINENLRPNIPPSTMLRHDLAAAIKGKRSLSSMREAVEAVALNAKIDASQHAERVRACVALLPPADSEHRHLFPDADTLALSKAPSDLQNLVAARISEYEARKQREAEAREQAEAAAREAEKADPRQEAAPSPNPANAQIELEISEHPFDTFAKTVESVPEPQHAVPIKLGDLNAIIAPLSITAEGMAQLGFQPISGDRRSKLYDASRLPEIIYAMVRSLARAAHARMAA